MNQLKYNHPSAQVVFDEVTKDKGDQFRLAVYLTERLMALGALVQIAIVEPRAKQAAMDNIETVVLTFLNIYDLNPTEVVVAADKLLHENHRITAEVLEQERSMSYVPGSTTLQ